VLPGTLDGTHERVGDTDGQVEVLEGVYHRRVHSETAQSPLERFMAAGPPALPSLAELHEAFLWSERRTVTKTATVSLHGNHYEVDPALVGRRVELVFDPFDLTDIEVRFDGRHVGKALPRRIGRHAHPHARPDAAAPPVERTGIDYLRITAAAHDRATARRIAYSALEPTQPIPQCPGQLHLPGTSDPDHKEQPSP
jgi:putative transposase